MLTLLDMCLDNTPAYTRGGAQVVTEQHDTSKITVEAAAVDSAIRALSGGRTWDAAEYGITLAQAQAQLEAANTPEAREQVMVGLRARAIRRAGLDTSNGRVNLVVAGQPAWHGLGVLVREAMASGQALQLSGLNWSVSKVPLSYFDPVRGENRTAKDAFGIVRNDTGEMLGKVGSRYTPIQNSDGFAFLDAVLAQHEARYESAGALFGGEQVFMLVHLPKQSFTLAGSDRTEAFAIFTNSHDGLSSAKCYPTSHRVVCANTLRLSKGDRDKGIAIRHTGNVKAKVREAQNALGLAVEEFTEYAQVAEAMSRAPADPIPFVEGLLDAVLDITAAERDQGVDALTRALVVTGIEQDAARKRVQRQLDNRAATLEDILTRYESDRCNVGGTRGTAWAALNAVTESADHGTLGGSYRGKTDDVKQSARFESVVSGRADEIKQVAYAQAKALIA